MKKILFYLLIICISFFNTACEEKSRKPGPEQKKDSQPFLAKGSLVYLNEKEVFANSYSEIMSLVEEGKWVNEGDLLCNLSPKDSISQLEFAKNDLKRQELEFNYLKDSLKQRQKLEKINLQIVKVKFQMAEVELQKAKTSRDWLRIFELEESLKVMKINKKLLELKLAANTELVEKGFVSKVNLLEIQKELKVLNENASLTKALIPELEKQVEEKRVFEKKKLYKAAEIEVTTAEKLLQKNLFNFETQLEIKNREMKDVASKVARLTSELEALKVVSPTSGFALWGYTQMTMKKEKISPGTAVYPGVTLFKIVQKDRVGIDSFFNQRDSSLIRSSSELFFYPDSFPELYYKCKPDKVSELAIAADGQNPDGLTFMNLKSELTGISEMLLHGFSGTLTNIAPPNKHSGKGLIKPLKVVKKRVSRTISVPGEVEPSEFSTISPPYNARLNSLVEEGKVVKAGEELARIDAGEREQKLSDEVVQIEKKREELKLLEEKFLNESSRLKSLEKIKKGALTVAQLEYKTLIKQRDEDKIINLRKGLELKKAKLKLAQQKYSHVTELNRKGLRSKLELLEAELEIANVKKDIEIESYKLNLEESGPTRNNIKLAQLNSEMAQLELEKAQVECSIGLKKGDFDIELNREELKSRELSKNEIQSQIDRATLKAARDGIVILLDTYISGEKRKAKVGDSIYGMIPLIQVADDSSLVIKTQISEMDIKFLKIGMKAIVKTKSAPGREFGAWVKKIGRIATNNSSERQDSIVEVLFDLKSVENGVSKIDPVFSPGSSCEVEIQLYDRVDAIWLPYGYVVPDSIGPGVIKDNGEFHPVKIDFSDGLNGYVLREGLNEGDTVCYPGGQND